MIVAADRGRDIGEEPSAVRRHPVIPIGQREGLAEARLGFVELAEPVERLAEHRDDPRLPAVPAFLGPGERQRARVQIGGGARLDAAAREVTRARASTARSAIDRSPGLRSDAARAACSRWKATARGYRSAFFGSDNASATTRCSRSRSRLASDS